MDNNEFATNHIWFTVGKTIENLNLETGDIIEFDARITDYEKGYVNHRNFIDNRKMDYKLSRPTKFEKISSKEQDLQAV